MSDSLGHVGLVWLASLLYLNSDLRAHFFDSSLMLLELLLLPLLVQVFAAHHGLHLHFHVK